MRLDIFKSSLVIYHSVDKSVAFDDANPLDRYFADVQPS